MFKTGKIIDYSSMKSYYENVCTCLIRDEKYEELVFFMLGVELAVRKDELIRITLKQCDLRNLKIYDIENIKDIQATYPPISISREVSELIEKYLSGSDDERLFGKTTRFYRDSIRESIGDEKFTLHDMRHIGKWLRILH